MSLNSEVETFINFEESDHIDVIEELVTVDVTEEPDNELTIEADNSLTFEQNISIDGDHGAGGTESQPTEDSTETEKPAATYIFKNPNFVVRSEFL